MSVQHGSLDDLVHRRINFDGSCAHPEIVEHQRFPDGSIDGRCTRCGECGESICPSCEALGPGTFCSDQVVRGGEHRPDCALAAALGGRP